MLAGVDVLLLAHLVVLSEVSIQVSLELLVSDEPQAAVRALELDAFVELGDGDDVEPKVS